MYQIAKKNLPALFQRIAEEQELYLPVKVSNQVNFAAWDKDAEVDLDTLKTVKSPKDAFFPQSENLYTVQKEGKKLSIEPEALKEQKFVVFGMKACDVQGVKVLDNVFLSEPVDTFYSARREHGTIEQGRILLYYGQFDTSLLGRCPHLHAQRARLPFSALSDKNPQ